jgi:coenzyme F420-0:L-glutamate ligase/coenzyme F420-1:gamma-L-glutamate ligase
VTLELRGVEGLPEIRPGDDLGTLIVENSGGLQEGDVIVVAQKVVSKAEGRIRTLSQVTPSERSIALAQRLEADPRLVQVILDETRRVVRDDRVLIVETLQGFVCANAGVDRSNVDGEDDVCLLPVDCDASARALHERIRALAGVRVGVRGGWAWSMWRSASPGYRRCSTIGVVPTISGCPCRQRSWRSPMSWRQRRNC